MFCGTVWKLEVEMKLLENMELELK